MHQDQWLLYLGLIVVAYTGSWSGKLLLTRFSTEAFRKLVLSIIAITGAVHLYMFFK
jgi:uncharacterized membrane protein YfcA